MMGAAQVSAGAAATGYYKTEGYYAAGTPEGDAAARWFGKEADSLGLEGRVDDALFASLLDGQTYQRTEGGLEKDRLMGRQQDGERKHRPGMDLTFSAPKSVSIAALVFDDKRVIEAHDKAVREALGYIESNVVETRRKVNGHIVTETGGKIIAGLFRHDTSRALDPQLHTHAVLANMVRNSTGNITALYNGSLFKQQKLGSEIYRASLAKSLHELGYTVERVGKDRLIELKEVPTDLLAHYSTRRAEIEAALDSREMPDNAKTAQAAALATRAAKTGVLDREQIREQWRNEAKDLGYDMERFAQTLADMQHKAATRLPGATRGYTPPAPATRAVRLAISHLSETSTVLPKDVLLSEALRFGKGVDASAAERAINQLSADGELLPAALTKGAQSVEGKGQHAPAFTTAHLREVENQIAKEVRRSAKTGNLPQSITFKGRKRSLVGAVDAALRQAPSLTEGQQDAIRVSMTGKEQFVAVQGLAGTGKTFALSQLVSLAERAGLRVEGLAPSHKAVEELKSAIPKTETVQARLMRGRSPDKEASTSKTIWVVDEASMLENSQALKLLRQAKEQGVARVVFVGDTKQLEGVGAGSPFALMQKSGITTAYMTDIVRQRDETLRSAVTHAVAGEIQGAFERLGQHITASPDIAAAAATAYLQLSPRQRERAAVVTPSNAVRVAINAHIRDGLKREGAIGSKDVRLPSLKPLRLSTTEAGDAASYRVGDVVLPHQSVKKEGLQRGQLYEVTSIERGTLSLTNRHTGEETQFTPSPNTKAVKSTEVFGLEERSYSVGERIKFTISDKEVGITNGDKGTISRIDQNVVRVDLPDGTSRELPTNQLAALGMDHGHSATGHDMQGATVDHVIVAMGANEYLADQKSFYVAISRARDDAHLITDNPERLAERLQEKTGEQVTALESYLNAMGVSREAHVTKDQDKNRDAHTDKPREPDQPKRDEEKERQTEKSDEAEPEREEKTREELVSESEAALRNLERAIQKEIGERSR